MPGIDQVLVNGDIQSPYDPLGLTKVGFRVMMGGDWEITLGDSTLTPAPGYKSALDPVSNQLKVMVTVHTFKLLSLGLNAQIRAFGNWNSVAQFGVADGSKLTGVHLEASLQPGIEATPYELVTGSGEKFHGFGLAVGDIDLSNDDADLDLINAPTDWVLDAINYPTIY